MLNLEGTKGVALSVMFVITMITSFSPIYVRKMFYKHLNETTRLIVLSCCLCFGAGVLLATVFLHILPEAVETVNDAMDRGLMRNISYPVTQILLCLGFFVVYFIEELVHRFLDKKNREHSNNGQVNKAFYDTEMTVSSGHLHQNGEPGHSHSHDHGDVQVLLKKASIVSSVIVIVALSFHGFMEGMALGLEEHATDVWLMFVALCSHKIFISFSMSMELLENGVSGKLLGLVMTVFALASPIGGLVGAIITADASNSDTPASVLAPAFLQAISAGTILYVTFCEVLERERAKEGGGMEKFASLLTGFCVMAALQTLDHDDDDSDSNETTEPSAYVTKSI